jgi:hypothetical protein
MIKINPRTGKRPEMPIGVQTFDEMASGEWVYVDKTALVYELATSSKHNFLSRPRRFGKSLLVSTLAAYFRGDKGLFNGLAMEGLEKEWVQHPVFVFDFVNGEFRDSNEQLRTFIDSKLSEFEEIWGKSDAEGTFGTRFAGVIARAVEKTGQRAVVLFDEYDKALTDTRTNPELNEQNKSTVKSIFSVLKGSDRHIRFSLLTGVTKFSKVSLFSDVNHLNDISLDEKYAAICGITQEELEENFEPEIQELALKNHQSYQDALDKLKQEYNGYHFFEDGPSVYNPFSTINVLAKSKYNDYWYKTGTPTFLVEELLYYGTDLTDFDDQIFATSIGIDEYRPESGDPVPLLLQSGYLTVKGFNSEDGLYELGFPNEEVRRGFSGSLINVVTTKADFGEAKDAAKFKVDLVNGDLETFFDRLKTFFAAYPFELFHKKDFEKSYQSVLYMLFCFIGQVVDVEKSTNKGRVDAIVKNSKHVYIFEFKTTKNGTVDDALEQIERRGYALQFENNPDESRDVTKVGVVFDVETRNISEWKVG